jgi:cyclopropane fatty-acyl-phospholipid synthase-like methyltransferase
MNYHLRAITFKAISATTPTKALYRYLGNLKTQRNLETNFLRWTWDKAEAAGATKAGQRILELGTGWTHANSLYLALLGDMHIHAFDVIDMRAISAFKEHVPRAAAAIAEARIAPERHANMKARVEAVARAQDWAAIYNALNITYETNDAGQILGVPAGSQDLIYSCDVLEHVGAEHFVAAAQSWFSLLKPGGRFIAQVGLDDHIAHGDKSKSKKEYLRFSKNTVASWLMSDLQYINRIPASKMLSELERAGFKIEQAERQTIDLGSLKVHPDWRDQLPEDLAAVRLHLVARKPASQ